ncbi:MAG: hypothetical protein G01um10147_633 [Microgenomates group bacterium Gr01-1014_7]|nr:MAG: hypothetical protein G01um10147_633 [Microgenomates group bacterium Gr01-1014_7]
MDRRFELGLCLAVSLAVAFGSEACSGWLRDLQYASGDNTRSIPSFSTDNPFIREARAGKSGLTFPQISDADRRRAIIWEESQKNK